MTHAVAAPDVVVYRTRYCPYCLLASRLLDSFQIQFREVDVSGDRERRRWLAATTGRSSVPQIFVGEHPIGGYLELRELLEDGPDALLRASEEAVVRAGAQPEQE